MSVDEESESAKAEISAIEAPDIPEVPLELVQNFGSKTSKLLGPLENVTPVSGRNREFEFRFKEPIFASHIEINTSGYPNNSEFLIELTNHDRSVEAINSVSSDNSVQCDLDNLIIGLSFTPPSITLSNTKILKVSIFGFPISGARPFLRHILFIDSRKKEALSAIDRELRALIEQRAVLTAMQSNRDSLLTETERLKSIVESESRKIRNFGRKIQDLNSNIESLKREEEHIFNEVVSATSKIDELKLEDGALTKVISEKTNELKTLKENVSIFPSEISGFAKQGAKDVKLYAWLSLIPMILIVAIAYSLFGGAVNLSTIITGSQSINIQALIASRAPFVAISASLIAASYYVIRLLILECIRVNRQKLNLTKISVVAKDISYAVEAGLEISDDEKYARRLRLKMDLMRDHLREYISKDFQPSLPEHVPNGVQLAAETQPVEG